MKKLILFLSLLYVFTGVSFGAQVTINDDRMIDNPMRERAFTNIDSNFTELYASDAAFNGENISDNTIDEDSIDWGNGTDQVGIADFVITNNALIYGDGGVGSEVLLTTDTIPGVDTGSVVAISMGDWMTISSSTLDVGSIPFIMSFKQQAVADTTALSTGTGKISFRAPSAMMVTAVRANVVTAGTGGSEIIIDINEGGSTILSTKLSIDSTETTSTTAATAAVISDTTIADDALMTIDFDQVGNTVAGSGVTIVIYGSRAI